MWFECPLKAKLAHLDHLIAPSSPQMERGNLFHQLAQDYVEGKLPSVPFQLAPFAQQFDMLRERKTECERKWGFTASWQPCDWNATQVWLRVKCDATFQQPNNSMVIIDLKTGRVYEQHEDQLELYALAGFAMFPAISMVVAQDWYLDQDEVATGTFTREQVPHLRATWDKRAAALLADTIFPPRPGPQCRRCPFSSRWGSGPCQF
jgi:hypothetical protein